MNGNTTVTAFIGYYEVCTTDAWGVQTHIVGKDKKCSCGGNSKHPCRHIRAVAKHLKAGGQRAPKGHEVRENGPLPGTPVVAPAVCPICNTPVKSENRGRWNCPNSSTHYFQWRGELGVRQFLCNPHPNKIGAFYEMSQEERGSFLETVSRRMRVGGSSPFN